MDLRQQQSQLQQRLPDIADISHDAMQMVLRGLEFCHARWVLHRDIKPNNFLVAPDGEESWKTAGPEVHKLAFICSKCWNSLNI